jgi:hypothetical protein
VAEDERADRLVRVPDVSLREAVRSLDVDDHAEDAAGPLPGAVRRGPGSPFSA